MLPGMVAASMMVWARIQVKMKVSNSRVVMMTKIPWRMMFSASQIPHELSMEAQHPKAEGMSRRGDAG